jgi:hypothetical protein
VIDHVISNDRFSLDAEKTCQPNNAEQEHW